MVATQVPSEEKVLAIHSELVAALGRKRDIEKSLLELEVQLYNYESSFLEKYSQGINLLKGFNAPSFFGTTGDGAGAGASLNRIDDSLRIFSNSSTTSHKISTHNPRKGSNSGSRKTALSKLEDEDDQGGLFHTRRKRSSGGLLVLSEDSEYECGKDGVYEDEDISSLCSSTDEEAPYGQDDNDHQYKSRNGIIDGDSYFIDEDAIPIRNKSRTKKKRS
ncbi:hypothetical protein DI09_99p90 [Mitosporidium daphniae]|uniref:Chromatin modification-related protein EAF6 n=1 Tax=Mitosporidium daphniae TaxID=1485682 RepID=A0A098VMF2_9MICR|nr:uncharacterized protein DI09_99p90 [Mitosporidium daphniae]KGG49964.1 hypothetical protein DI09_99p90 [Mitosporidium daphniae]|eukprot:XP_013236400.1 uncharacterized protein DI09_99p90 [Mitosporidium daphniae]